MKLKFNLRKIATQIGGRFTSSDGRELLSNAVSIDSRTLNRGDLFIPIKGTRYNGNDFIEEAISRGASGAVIDNLAVALKYPSCPMILVEDNLNALQFIASYRRESIKGLKVIAITGSVGKTTVKELVASIMSTKYSTIKSEGNLNNHIGLPLSLLKIDRDHKVAVVELGMNAKGEIKQLSKIATPDIAIITNVKHAHLSSLKSIEEIALAKSELIVELPANKIALINHDDLHLKKTIAARRRRGLVMTFGKNKQSDVVLLDSTVSSNGCSILTIQYKKQIAKFDSPLLGKHNDENVLAAVAVGLISKIPVAKIQRGINSTKSVKGRMQHIKVASGIDIIDDSYNANPASMEAALDFLATVGNYDQRIAVVGDMNELGKFTHRFHREVIKQAALAGIDILVGVGELLELAIKSKSYARLQCKSVKSHKAAFNYIARKISSNSIILVKGSRAAKMEAVVGMLESKLGAN